jgi:hypothetical protein
MTAVKIIHHLMLLLALFEQSLLLQSLTWVILWLEEDGWELALLLAVLCACKYLSAPFANAPNHACMLDTLINNSSSSSFLHFILSVTML